MKLSKLFTAVVLSLGLGTQAFAATEATITKTADKSATASSHPSTASLQSTEPPALTLEIMHVNDMHSYLEPSELTFNTDAGRVRAKAGGATALSAIVKAHRKQNPQLLVVSAGDQITGNASNYDLFHGESDAVVHKHLKTDFYTLGNHEFDHGSQGMTAFANFLKKYSPKTRLVISNVEVADSDPIKPFISKSIITTVTGVRIAILAITDPKKIYQSSKPAPDVVIKDAVSTVNSLTSSIVINKEADIIMLLTHEGVALDRINASAFNDVDIIIGGDSHSLCGNLKGTGLQAECLYPMTLKNARGNSVCVVQAYEHTKLIGDLFVDLNANGKVLSCRGTPLMPVSSSSAHFKDSSQSKADSNNTQAITAIKVLISQTPEFEEASSDPELDSDLKPYLDSIHEHFNHVLGEAPEDLCSTRLPNEPCEIKGRPAPQGSETCQVFGQVFLKELAGDVYIGNSGGVRADLAHGEINLDKIMKSIPFTNKLIMVELTGTELKELLNQAFRYILREPVSRSGSVPCGYGLIYTLNENEAKNEPVSDIKLLSLADTNEDQTLKLIDLDPEKTYRIITNDYLMQGKDGYVLLKKKTGMPLGTTDVQVLSSYLEKNKVLPLLKPEAFMMHKVIESGHLDSIK